MNVITRITFDNARTKAISRFGTSNLHFSEYPIHGGWKLDIRVAVMLDSTKMFDMEYGVVTVMDDGKTHLTHRTGEFNTIDELLDILADRLSKMYKDYKEFVRTETEELLETL